MKFDVNCAELTTDLFGKSSELSFSIYESLFSVLSREKLTVKSAKDNPPFRQIQIQDNLVIIQWFVVYTNI